MTRTSRPAFTLALVAAMSLALPAIAQDEEDDVYARSGIYFSVNGLLGVGTTTWESVPGATLEDDFTPGTAGGFHLNLGYRFKPRWAAEFYFENLIDFPIPADSPTDSGVPIDVIPTKVSSMNYGLNLKWYILDSRFQPYLLVGMSGTTMTTKFNRLTGGESAVRRSDTVLSGRFAAGLDWYWTENWVVQANANYIVPEGDLGSTDYLSIGLGAMYRF